MPGRYSPLLQQRVVRGRQLPKGFRAAAGVRVRPLGKQLVGAMDFAFGEIAAERQPQKLAAALFRRQGFGQRCSPAEMRRRERRQHLTNDAKPPAGRNAGRVIGADLRSASQNRECLSSRLTQRLLLACRCDLLHKPHCFAIVGRMRRPQAIEFELPFDRSLIHDQTPQAIKHHAG